MNRDLLLVGSAPLGTAEETFSYSFGSALGPHLAARCRTARASIAAIGSSVLRIKSSTVTRRSKTIRRPKPDENGVERVLPVALDDYWQFRVRDGVDAVRFGAPGERLGYAKDAINSYFAFLNALKNEGSFPKELRFQVSLPR